MQGISAIGAAHSVRHLQFVLQTGFKRRNLGAADELGVEGHGMEFFHQRGVETGLQALEVDKGNVNFQISSARPQMAGTLPVKGVKDPRQRQYQLKKPSYKSRHSSHSRGGYIDADQAQLESVSKARIRSAAPPSP